MTMNIKLNTIVEFYLKNDPIPKSGFVLEIMDSDIKVRVEHGELHGQVVIVDYLDIIDDSFDNFELGDEKLYSWHDGE